MFNECTREEVEEFKRGVFFRQLGDGVEGGGGGDQSAEASQQ